MSTLSPLRSPVSPPPAVLSATFHFLKLPDELQEMIYRYVVTPKHTIPLRPSTPAICRVSQHLRSLTLPLFYEMKSFSFEIQLDAYDTEGQLFEECHPIHLLTSVYLPSSPKVGPITASFWTVEEERSSSNPAELQLRVVPLEDEVEFTSAARFPGLWSSAQDAQAASKRDVLAVKDLLSFIWRFVCQSKE